MTNHFISKLQSNGFVDMPDLVAVRLDEGLVSKLLTMTQLFVDCNEKTRICGIDAFVDAWTLVLCAYAVTDEFSTLLLNTDYDQRQFAIVDDPDDTIVTASALCEAISSAMQISGGYSIVAAVDRSDIIIEVHGDYAVSESMCLTASELRKALGIENTEEKK